MTILTTGSDRAALITGLIDLATFLAVHPDVPIASAEGYTARVELGIYPAGTMTERCGDVDAIAAQIGEAAQTPEGRTHYVTERHFGPVSYKAVAIAPKPALVQPAVRAA